MVELRTSALRYGNKFILCWMYLLHEIWHFSCTIRIRYHCFCEPSKIFVSWPVLMRAYLSFNYFSLIVLHNYFIVFLLHVPVHENLQRRDTAICEELKPFKQI
jgi:hypothetical protein